MNEIFLKDLLETTSPSGFEQTAAKLWREEAKKITNLVYGDIHGNSIAAISDNRRPSSTRIMLAGHIDEIGLMVSYIDDKNGFVYFRTIGGWDPQILPGQRVKIYTKNGKILKGCIGRTPIHLLKDEERKQAVKIESMWIDVGGSENVKQISIGDYAVLDYGPEFLNDNILVGRGIDDRIGAFVVLEALRTINKNARNEIFAVATVQEEIGLRGAITSTFSIKPQIGIAVDVTFATDCPGADKTIGDIKLDAGPVISIGPNITPSIHKLLVETAREYQIPFQIEAAPRGTGTDANVIQLSRNGVATGLVSIPNRYMHSPCEMIDLRDVENTINLIARFCEKEFRELVYD